jgi:hypothetical protein
MSSKVRRKKGFTIPEGTYQGILFSTYDLRTQTSEKYPNEAEKGGKETQQTNSTERRKSS